MTYPTPNKSKENYTLGELEALQREIVAWAHAEGVFGKILTVGRELPAAVVGAQSNTYLISLFGSDADLPVSPVVVVYREYTGRILSMTSPSTWETIEQVSVYLGPEGATIADVIARDGSNNPQFYKGLMVMSYQRSTHPTGNEKEFIAPGRWVEVLLRQHDRAEDMRRQAAMEADNTSRDRLYREMLLDKDL